jgi:hypothetical protein
MKSKKNQKNTLNIQHNKYVMYILLIVAVINLLMFLQYNYLGSILLFLVVGLLTTLYTKNMNIILFSTIIITNITVFVAKMFGYAEGMGPLTKKDDKPIKCKGGDGKTTNLKMVNQPLFAQTKKKKDDDDDEDDEGFIGYRGGARSLDAITNDAFTDGYSYKGGYSSILREGYKDKDEKDEEKNKKSQTTPPPTTQPTKQPTTQPTKPATTQPTKPATTQPTKPPPKIKEQMKNKNEEEDDDDDEGFKTIQEDIEESEKLNKSLRTNKIPKDAEKEIKKLLNGTDIKNLNTNELIEQQKGLMDAMKNMDPLIKSVNEMIKNLKNSPISGFMGLGK